MPEEEAEEEEDREYDSGPFCRHWADPADCEEKCKTCGHGCTRHDLEDGESECNEDDCKCLKWEDTE